MRVIITGACGYVGSALYRYLAARGYDLLSIDDERRGNPGEIPNNPRDYAWLIPNHVGPFDAIIHLAAHATVAECNAQPHRAFYNNLVQPINMVDRLTGQTFIYASSGSVHSANGMTSVYDYTKRALEQAMGHFYPQSVGLRFGTVCGPSPNMRGTMMNAMVENALKRGIVEVSNVQARRPILGINDLCRAIEQQIENPMPGVHDLASFTHTIGGIGGEVAQHFGRKFKIMPDSQTYDFVMICADWFQPQETIESIIEGLVAHHAAWVPA